TGYLRWNNGRLEYNDGGTWKPVGGVVNTPLASGGSATTSSQGTWYNLVTVSGLGSGMIGQIQITNPPGNTSTNTYSADIRVDGVSNITDMDDWPISHWNGTTRVRELILPIYFNTSFQI